MRPITAAEDRPAPRTIAGLTPRWFGALALGLLTAIAALAMVVAPTVEDGGLDCGSVVAPQDETTIEREVGEAFDGEEPVVQEERTVRRDAADVLRCTTRRQQQLGYATLALTIGGLATCAGIARAASRDSVDGQAGPAA